MKNYKNSQYWIKLYNWYGFDVYYSAYVISRLLSNDNELMKFANDFLSYSSNKNDYRGYLENKIIEYRHRGYELSQKDKTKIYVSSINLEKLKNMITLRML